MRNPGEKQNYTSGTTPERPLLKQQGHCDSCLKVENTSLAMGNREAMVQKCTQSGLGIGLLGNP